jgi:hypothetical protein
MNSYYQLILLGDTISETCRKVKGRFFGLLNERGFNKQFVAVLDGSLTLTPPDTGGYDSTKPTFSFNFGKQGQGDNDTNAIKKLMENGDAVYPVFFNNLEEELPEVLRPVNGVKYGKDKLDSIVNVAFEELRLLRKKRRVFISYKRSDSSAVANQLFDIITVR